MSRLTLLAAAMAFALSGCGAGGDNESANAANAMPPSKTENGQLTARVQGVDLKVNLPAPIRRMTEEDDFIPPRARVERGGEAQVRRFHSDETPEAVARWYQDTARSGRFTIAASDRQGAAFVMTGYRRNRDILLIRLVPRAGGGTNGTVTVDPRS